LRELTLTVRLADEAVGVLAHRNSPKCPNAAIAVGADGMRTTHLIVLLVMVNLAATLGVGLVGCAVIAAFFAGVLFDRATRRFGPMD
jgi:hypothetical protein